VLSDKVLLMNILTHSHDTTAAINYNYTKQSSNNIALHVHSTVPQEVICHSTVPCHPTCECAPPNPSQKGWYSTYLAQRHGRLS